jgi:hypothetical protein
VPEALSIAAPFLIAVVLVWSAVGKVREPAVAAEGFTALRVPSALSRPWIVRSHPFVELALAVLLVVGAGWLGTVGALGTLALMVVYLVLVVRAVRGGEDVDCACFGAWGPGRVTWATVWRNAWLVLLAVLSVWAASDGPSLITRAADADSGWWVLSLAAALVTASLVLLPETGGARSPVQSDQEAGEGDLEDYVRLRTPAVPVMLADGSTCTLRELSASRAQLLLFVSKGCGSCADVIAAAPQWRERIPQIDIRLVLRGAPASSDLTSTDEPQTVHDVNSWLRDSFGTRGTPSAVLLGVDGHLAGGPIGGKDKVRAFVADIEEQLSAALATSDP